MYFECPIFEIRRDISLKHLPIRVEQNQKLEYSYFLSSQKLIIPILPSSIFSSPTTPPFKISQAVFTEPLPLSSTPSSSPARHISSSQSIGSIPFSLEYFLLPLPVYAIVSRLTSCYATIPFYHSEGTFNDLLDQLVYHSFCHFALYSRLHVFIRILDCQVSYYTLFISKKMNKYTKKLPVGDFLHDFEMSRINWETMNSSVKND